MRSLEVSIIGGGIGGLTTALAFAGGGIVFVALLGWRMVPAREQKGVEGFDTGTYLTEARIVDG